MSYESFIKKMAAAAVAGGAAYLTAKYSGRGLDVAVIAASAQVVVEEAEDLAKHARTDDAEKKRTSTVSKAPETKAEDPIEPSLDHQPKRKARAMGLH